MAEGKEDQKDAVVELREGKSVALRKTRSKSKNSKSLTPQWSKSTAPTKTQRDPSLGSPGDPQQLKRSIILCFCQMNCQSQAGSVKRTLYAWDRGAGRGGVVVLHRPYMSAAAATLRAEVEFRDGGLCPVFR